MENAKSRDCQTFFVVCQVQGRLISRTIEAYDLEDAEAQIGKNGTIDQMAQMGVKTFVLGNASGSELAVGLIEPRHMN